MSMKPPNNRLQPTAGAPSRLELTALETATTIDDMAVPGFRLHPLKGDRKGEWAMSVSGHWRTTFEFRDGNAYLIDYEDYH